MSSNITEELIELKTAPEFKRLVKALAEWMVLIELCKDFITRIETYELSIFIDSILLN